MATLQIPLENLSIPMNSVSAIFRSNTRFPSTNFRVFCGSSGSEKLSQQLIQKKKKVFANGSCVPDSEHRENWLASLSCPFDRVGKEQEREESDFEWIIGVDPDVSGALALLKSNDSGCSAQVFDTPHLQVLVGGRIRRRLDAKSIVQLLRNFGAPLGTTAYIEQSTPFPKDGKQGWWGGGFGYGLWIGILVASGFSVIPVPSLVWKNQFDLSGGTSTKDDSRKAASMLFPLLDSELKRKKDHGRADALLIAAYGKGLRKKVES